MDDNLFKIIIAVLSILGTILTGIVIPYIKEKIGNEKLAKYEYWANYAVKAAEMIFAGQGMGEAKKEYVINFLDNMFNKNKVVITPEQIEVLIEAAVKIMKSEEITFSLSDNELKFALSHPKNYEIFYVVIGDDGKPKHEIWRLGYLFDFAEGEELMHNERFTLESKEYCVSAKRT